jgi:uridine phosphorylase
MTDRPGKILGQASAVPLLEFDPDRTALIEPSRSCRPNPKMPERAVICFLNNALQKFAQEQSLEIIGHLFCESAKFPVYLTEHEGVKVALAHPGVGAPLAAGLLEELIAMGATKFVGCGGAGVLDRTLAVGHLLVPTSAVRDEGTSYHYLPPAREVAASPKAVSAIAAVLKSGAIPFLKTKTWTTDGIYRETRDRIARRKAEGCLSVEMEAAALFAVGLFRSVDVGMILYAGDDVSGPEWDHRGWQERKDVRERLLQLAIRSAAAMRDG